MNTPFTSDVLVRMWLLKSWDEYADRLVIREQLFCGERVFRAGRDFRYAKDGRRWPR